ncbi:MAG: hypothetical protein MUD01_17410 [Chloroflexaceae bacterium]|jgi:hypothetical protein|nr:hypothetical protein [Chloroflexaceae bacterium]
MTTLPIKRMQLYKHGVGYFERRGPVSGTSLRLNFPRPAMDDVLKSLIALDLGAGQVLSIDFETPEDRAALLAKGSIHLSDNRSLLDLLRDLRGRRVRCTVGEHDTLEGLVVGVDYEDEEALKRASVSLYLPEGRQVRTVALERLRGVELLDESAAADLSYFLRAAQSEEERRSATLHLSPGGHDLLVGYIAPAPAWRVSYRMLFEQEDSQLLLQGWGLFDNQLEEDLNDVELTLVAGMPVSFRYRLYEPKTPERPLVEDEERTVNAPLFFESMPAPAAAMVAAPAPAAKRMRAANKLAADGDMMAFGGAISASAVAETVQAAASGAERGALFAYAVGHPVSVARGQSAMVPIVSLRLPCRRELLYNGRKQPSHPVASMRLKNDTGLTLERGPVTVLEEGDYAGEAVLPFTSVGGELLVPYAVELGIKVVEQRQSEMRLAAVRLRNDYLLIEEYDIQRTRYDLTSSLPKDSEVVIEHVTISGYDLVDTVEPAERNAESARWPVNCPANSRTVFTVSERRLTQRREEVRRLSGQRLQSLLKDGLLDAATAERLEAVLNLYQQISELQYQVQSLNQEREAIYTQQRQIQGNLGPLGRSGDEGALRTRYVTELNRLEDRLTSIGADEQRLKAQIAELEQQVKALLGIGD